jgi:hypothetical protein
MRKLALSLLVVLAGCAAPDRAQPSAAGQSDTLARIHALIGTPGCSADSQCRSLAVGERPCGGPESYLAYSTARATDAELQALGASYRAERRKANAEAGRVSDCRFMPDPGALCRAGTCVLGAGGAVAR